jgi:hypothetical protein
MIKNILEVKNGRRFLVLILIKVMLIYALGIAFSAVGFTHTIRMIAFKVKKIPVVR